MLQNKLDTSGNDVWHSYPVMYVYQNSEFLS